MNKEQQTLKALQEATEKAEATEAKMYDLLFEVRSQLTVLDQLIGDTTDGTVQLNAYGLASLIGDIGDKINRGIDRLFE